MEEMTPVEELMHEHQHILKVVNALKILADRIEQGDVVDIELLHGAGRFLYEFADVCHHGKEEAVLFPAMERSGVPEQGCPLGALRSEHTAGRRMVASFRKSVEAYASNREVARAGLVSDIAAIAKFYPDHIWKEDDMVFPMVDRLFEPEDLEQLRVDFDKAEEELGENHDWFVTFSDQIAEAAVNFVK